MTSYYLPDAFHSRCGRDKWPSYGISRYSRIHGCYKTYSRYLDMRIMWCFLEVNSKWLSIFNIGSDLSNHPSYSPTRSLTVWCPSESGADQPVRNALILSYPPSLHSSRSFSQRRISCHPSLPRFTFSSLYIDPPLASFFISTLLPRVSALDHLS